MKTYSKPNPVSNPQNYFGKLITFVRQEALKKGLVNQGQFEAYLESVRLAEEHVTAREKGEGTKEAFQARVKQLEGKSEEDNLAIAKLSAIEYMIYHAHQSAEFANKEIPVKERFKRMIRIAHSDGDLDLLGEIKKDMIISFTHTMHPTIHETPFANRFVSEIIQALELAGENAIDRSRAMYGIETTIGNFVKDVVAGNEITPSKQVTVQQETDTEQANLDKMSREIDQTVEYWNEAIEEVKTDLAVNRAGKTNLKNSLDKLKIDEADRARIFEPRSWGIGSADADGRPLAISLVLSQAVRDRVIDGVYKGPKLDLRQGAPMHSKLVNVLIHKLYIENDDFQIACDTFNAWTSAQSGNHKLRSDKVLYAQLQDGDRAELLKWMIRGTSADGKAFVVPSLVTEGLKEYVVDFNDKYYTVYQQFIKDYGLDPTVTFSELEEKVATVNKSGSKIDKVEPGARFKKGVTLWMVLSAIMDSHGYSVDRNGSYKPTEKTNPDRDYLLHTISYNPDGKGKDKYVYLRREEDTRKSLMETVKRMIIINDAIDKFGPDVATRYQLANFSSVENFYETLLLFKDTGLATIENGLVVSSKVSIQPLFETIEDMRNAPDIIRQLLSDPLILSWYKSRGNIAEFMLGFSDGAKSGGNLKSEWEIYKLSREMSEIFAEHGIQLRIFEGRGRGLNRGGTNDNPEIARKLMPYEYTRHAIFDQTVQSDLPLEAKMDPAFGERYFAGTIIGTMTQALKARKMTPEQLVEIRKDEWIINQIADKSAELFQQKVRHNPQVAEFLDGMFLHMSNASRPPKRPNGKPSEVYEGTRAIPVEMKQVFADLPMHNIGQKIGVMEFINDSALGTPEQNLQKIQKLFNTHQFFREFILRARDSMEHYHPDVAESYAEKMKANANKFVVEAIEDLNGWQALLEKIIEPKVKGKHTRKVVEPDDMCKIGEVYDTRGHMQIGSLPVLESKLPDRPDEKVSRDEMTKRYLMTTLLGDNAHSKASQRGLVQKGELSLAN